LRTRSDPRFQQKSNAIGQTDNRRFMLPLDEYDEEELMLSDDLWRPCPSYEGYDASIKGWVRSWVSPRHSQGLIHEGRRINVRRNGEILNRTRGQLVADAFLVQPEPTWQLCYLDGDNKNFEAKNLTWEPRQDRVTRANAMGKHFGQNKTHCKWGHPLSDDTVRITVGGSRMCLVCARAHASMNQYKRRLLAKGETIDHLTFEYVLKQRGDWVEPQTSS
jgi:hypothetical protein